MLVHQNGCPINPHRVVIYGSNGFAGQALKHLLISQNINHLCLSRKDFNFTDLNAGERLASILRAEDTLVIVAAITPDKSRDVDSFFSNIVMIKHVCEALERVTPSHVVYFSSDAVYSSLDETVYDHTLCSPEGLYGIMHYARESMIKSATQAPVAILRPTLIYGALDTHNSYGPNRLRRMAAVDKAISLFGQGEEMRDHIYIEDVVKLALLSMQYKSVGTIYLATGKSISYLELAQKVASNFEYPIPIYSMQRSNSIFHRHYDISALHNAFPDFVFTSLDKGLAEAHMRMMEELNGKAADHVKVPPCINSEVVLCQAS